MILQTCLRISSYEPPTLAYRVGLVVTPSRTPQRAAVLISSMSAVSRKIFMRSGSSGAVGRAESTTRIAPAVRTGRRVPRRIDVTGPIASAATTARTGHGRVAARAARRGGAGTTAARGRGSISAANSERARIVRRAGRGGRAAAPRTRSPRRRARPRAARRRSPAASRAPCRQTAPAPPMTGPASSATAPQTVAACDAPIARKPWPKTAIRT